jgi:hypothetical protein
MRDAGLKYRPAMVPTTVWVILGIAVVLIALALISNYQSVT